MNATGSTALAMENAALRAEVASRDDQFQQYARKMESDMNALAAQNEKLREAGVTMSRAADRFFDSAKEQQARAEAAEVENERLRAALEDIADGLGETDLAEVGRYAKHIARAALEK